MINHGGNHRFQFMICTLRDSSLSITIMHYQTMHTTDKRIASWSEQANVYKEYMARSRHEAPRQNTSRRSKGPIEGCLEAPIQGHSHNTQTKPIKHTKQTLTPCDKATQMTTKSEYASPSLWSLNSPNVHCSAWSQCTSSFPFIHPHPS